MLQSLGGGLVLLLGEGLLELALALLTLKLLLGRPVVLDGVHTVLSLPSASHSSSS